MANDAIASSMDFFSTRSAVALSSSPDIESTKLSLKVFFFFVVVACLARLFFQRNEDAFFSSSSFRVSYPRLPFRVAFFLFSSSRFFLLFLPLE